MSTGGPRLADICWEHFHTPMLESFKGSARSFLIISCKDQNIIQTDGLFTRGLLALACRALIVVFFDPPLNGEIGSKMFNIYFYAVRVCKFFMQDI